MDIDNELAKAKANLDRLKQAQKEQRRIDQQERWRKEAEERANHAAMMRSEYLPGLPESVTDKVYAYAYEDSHSMGYEAVEGYYSELAELIQLTWNESIL